MGVTARRCEAVSKRRHEKVVRAEGPAARARREARAGDRGEEAEAGEGSFRAR